MKFNELLEESMKHKFKKLLDKIGWFKSGTTPDQIRKRIEDLDDHTLVRWHFMSKFELEVPNAPSKLTNDLIKREIKQRKIDLSDKSFRDYKHPVKSSTNTRKGK
mgnify:CR=1 FL=1